MTPILLVPHNLSGLDLRCLPLLTRNSSTYCLDTSTRLLNRRQSTPLHRPDGLDAQRIHDSNRGHGLNNRHSTRHHTRIVPSLSLQSSGLSIVSSRSLRLANGGRALKGNLHVDILAVRDTTLDSSGVVGLGLELTSDRIVLEHVVVAGTRDLSSSEAGTNLKALGSGDGHHGVGELSFELVKTRLTETGGKATDDNSDGTANTVSVVAVLGNQVGHLLRSLGVGAASGNERVDILTGDVVEESVVIGGFGGEGKWEIDGTDGGDKGNDGDVVSEGKVLLSNGTSSDTA